MTKKTAAKTTTGQRSVLLTDVPGLTEALTGNAILRKALTDALNKSALIPGALVVLKSGGPVMTIERTYDQVSGSCSIKPDARDTRAVCVWYSPNESSVKRTVVALACLQLAPK
jgi:uncharacterized protein YodC (DUF2158 family)